MKRFALPLAVLASALGFSESASAALVVYTSPFIGTVSNFNGFEGIGVTNSFTGPYTEGGITVAQNDLNYNIWTDSQSGEGLLSWYPNGGNSGYTDITLSGGGLISAIEFLAGSGWFGNGAGLQYELLNGGLSVASGSAGPVPTYGNGFVTYGFSGIAFDEVRLQAQNPDAGSFGPTAFQALALDGIKIGSPRVSGPVPEPATWALMLLGFGFVGFAMRKRSNVRTTVSYA